MNKVSVSELLRSHDEGGELVGNITTDNFVGSLKLLQCPVNNDENISKLSAIYDKAKHGRINYDDLLEEHKYVHAVSAFLNGFMWANQYIRYHSSHYFGW